MATKKPGTITLILPEGLTGPHRSNFEVALKKLIQRFGLKVGTPPKAGEKDDPDGRGSG